MDLGLKNKTALVLASSKGLGKATAKSLVREGANVVICGRDQNTLQKSIAEIHKEGGGEVRAFRTDLTDEEGRESLVEFTRSSFGPIDILVTNSGGPPAGTFENFSTAQWKDYFELLFIPVVHLIELLTEDLKNSTSGRILMITSVTLKQPVDNLITSNAVRTSLLGLMKSLSNELGPHGVTVNSLLPGFTLTDRLKNLIDQNPNINDVKDTIPLRRFANPDEFGDTAAFMVSERASYINGVALPVDGGWIKGL